ncbi:22.7 kDa class IV heat shock protein [Cryptomeria japonica]|uniref:22.7 kDa class IV heat shock protein n=1 Tax=Cryptomeria japonica TaxID=3369 RepID=UPI0027DA5772|nr:22.7 kDa class IV heat shock protein [Cryptomeria japonica]XP_057845774.2 22.7 kDa class IV heat shock protein [Cryptomeria japonica]
MAKTIAILGIVMVFTASFLSPARAFLPYRWLYGDLWNPLKVLDRLPRSISKIMKDPTLVRTNWKETPQAHVFTLNAPGMKKGDIKIEAGKNGVITISGERSKKEKKVGYKWRRRESCEGKFWRQFRLSGNVDMGNIKADLGNGVLTVTVPKTGSDKTKTPKIVEIVATGDGIKLEL